MRYNDEQYLRLSEVSIQGGDPKGVVWCEYLVSTVTEDETLEGEIPRREQAGRKYWREMLGVLCVRRINVKIKGVVRPAMM